MLHAANNFALPGTWIQYDPLPETTAIQLIDM